MAEWSNAAVLKTVVRATGPGVRIPLSPPKHWQTKPTHAWVFAFTGVDAPFERAQKGAKAL